MRENKTRNHMRTDRPGLRMNELADATGLPKSTILHYVAQGLLPKPAKTSRNMAYYNPACIERALSVRAMQDQYSFPLAKIKALLSARDRGKDITSLIQLNQAIFGKGEGHAVDEAAFCRATKLTHRQLMELLTAKLLMPLEKGHFDQNDIVTGQIYAESLALGVTIPDLAFYPALAKKVVDNEMKVRRRLTKDLPEKQDADVTRRLVQGARLLRNYIIERLFQHRVASARNLKDKVLLS